MSRVLENNAHTSRRGGEEVFLDDTTTPLLHVDSTA